MDCPHCQHLVGEGELFCGNCGLPLKSLETLTEDLPASQPNTISQSADPLIGRVLDTKYELVERLGEGGMGTVYRARRVHIGDEVAVKVLLQKYVAGHEAVERFRREARAAAVLRHPNVVTIHDFSEARGPDAPAYIVMELVEGTSLRALLQLEGRLAPERAVSLMRGICAGVSVAHRRSIIHRDLKPDNIIVVPPDREGESEAVKVIDFGIAKLRDSDMVSTLTQVGAIMGTPFYMSPEQCRGETLDARSDVYSLGAILYEMLSGTPPFTGTTPTAIVAKHLTETPPRLAEALGVPPALEHVCLRALVKKPDGRYQSVEALYSDLARALGTAGREGSSPGYLSGAAQTAYAVTPTASSPMGQSTDETVPSATSPALAPTVLAQNSMTTAPPQETLRAAPDKTASMTAPPAVEPLTHDLRPIRNFAIIGALVLFALSLGVGFLARRMEWANAPLPYDEFVLALVTVALRDAIFGAFLGVVFSEMRRTAPRWSVVSRQWAGALLVYGATGAAILMAPFVLLRTTLFALPLALAAGGFIAGMLVCGAKIAMQKVMMRG